MSMSSFQKPHGLRQQYATDENLSRRIRLHQQYRTNPQDWESWVFQNYRLLPDLNILELGCGNAGIWRTHAHQLPKGIRLVLSDFSPGMLDAAKANTEMLSGVDYRVIDAQEIPYECAYFDLVIANHMLYHVPNPNRALSEIHRVLKPEGTVYTTAIGKDNLKELFELLCQFDEQIDFGQTPVTQTFGLETGAEKLGHFFRSVDTRRYEDHLHVTDPKPLIEYVLSAQGIGNVTQRITGDKVAQFTRFIQGQFIKESFLDIRKDAGILISKGKIDLSEFPGTDD